MSCNLKYFPCDRDSSSFSFYRAASKPNSEILKWSVFHPSLSSTFSLVFYISLSFKLFTNRFNLLLVCGHQYKLSFPKHSRRWWWHLAPTNAMRKLCFIGARTIKWHHIIHIKAGWQVVNRHHKIRGHILRNLIKWAAFRIIVISIEKTFKIYFSLYKVMIHSMLRLLWVFIIAIKHSL